MVCAKRHIFRALYETGFDRQPRNPEKVGNHALSALLSLLSGIQIFQTWCEQEQRHVAAEHRDDALKRYPTNIFFF